MEADYDFTSHGSIVLIRPLTEAAAEHAETAFEGAMWFAGAIACEPRYAEAVARRLMDDDGMAVSFGGKLVEPA